MSGTPLRAKLVGAMGEWPYRGLYSVVALATLAWMVWAYGAAPREPLWPGLRFVPLVAMPLAFVLIACGYARNPTAIGGEKLLAAREPARGVIRITRHPIMWGVMLWAGAHALARGDSASLVFFGGFLALAALGTLSMDRRKRTTHGAQWERLAAVTSHIPFVAVAQGRNRIAWDEIGWRGPLLGLGLFALLLALHPWLFGARPY